MEYYFQTEKMTVGYDGKPLLRNIEIGLHRGEILVLIGPNGAGKSTILKSITRQLALLGGTIYLDKECMEDITSQKLARKIAVVLTDKMRTEMMTCEEVVATGRYPYTGRFGLLSEKDRQKVREAMELVHVSEIKDLDFRQISDGQRQRVMLARAVCQETDFVILDEPTSYLDVKYKLEFLSVLQDMKHRRQLTVIMSLHELELAERIADKILCVNGESVERYGSPEEIFKQGYITRLFGITAGCYEEESGNIELMPVKGQPKVFVIAGNGCGRKVFHRLQREGIAFAAGIIYRNDLDYPSAMALASQLFAADSFEPVPESILESAKKSLESCEKVICCRREFGSYEIASGQLLNHAKRCRKKIAYV